MTIAGVSGGAARWDGEESAGLANFLGMLGSIRDDVFLGMGDGLDVLLVGALANELYVLLEA